jgi:hypothetical protein
MSGVDLGSVTGAPAAAPEAKPMHDARAMVVVLNAEERVVAWNRAAAERLHFGDGESSGALREELYRLCWATEEERRAAFAEALASGTWRGRSAGVLDGGPADIESTVSVLLDTNEESVGAVITLRDVTRQDRREAGQAERSVRVPPAPNHTEPGTGAIPVCASCKAMCDSGGDWLPAEAYVGQRFHAEFTHGMCPECLQRFYPDLGGNGPATPR